MLRRISSFAAGARSKWVVIAFWLILGVALFGFQPKLQEATTNENEAFLPENAESTEVNDAHLPRPGDRLQARRAQLVAEPDR